MFNSSPSLYVSFVAFRLPPLLSTNARVPSRLHPSLSDALWFVCVFVKMQKSEP